MSTRPYALGAIFLISACRRPATAVPPAPAAPDAAGRVDLTGTPDRAVPTPSARLKLASSREALDQAHSTSFDLFELRDLWFRAQVPQIALK